MKVLWVIVNYNSPFEARKLIQSIPEKIDILLISNGTEYVKDLPKNVKQLNRENKGYFAYWNEVDMNHDWYIYSNSDVVLESENIIDSLSTFPDDILAPNIVNKSGLKLNPKELQSPSKSKLRRLQVIYSNNVSFMLYQYLGKLRSVFGGDKTENIERYSPMFAPHGAVFIVRKNESLLKRLMLWDNFMFGEELFLGCEARDLGLTVSYDDRIQFSDIGSVSVSNEGVFRRRVWYYDSIKYILERFYI